MICFSFAWTFDLVMAYGDFVRDGLVDHLFISFQQAGIFRSVR